MKTCPRIAAAVLLAVGATAASAHGGRGGWGIGLNFGFPVWTYPTYSYPSYGTVYSTLPAGAVSISIGGGRYWRHGGIWLQAAGPAWVVVPPPPASPPPAVAEAPPPPAAPARPDPVIYPRNGQDANQTEYDRQECNRWAVTQPDAVADASAFQRAVQACMDGRGYSMR